MSVSSVNRRRILSLWLPRLPTDRIKRRLVQEDRSRACAGLGEAFFRKPFFDKPWIVADKQQNALQIVAMNDAAAAIGLEIGMPVANARAICPDAEVKIFVVADPKVRAHRRTLEALARGETADEALVLADILKRDERDKNRAAAPLKRAPDAHVLDNSNLDIEGGVRAAIAIIERVRAGR